MRQQIVAAITSARAENGPHFSSAEHLVQFADPPLQGAGKIKLAFKDGRQIERLVTHLAQGVATSLEILPLESAGRRDNANRVTLPQGGRTQSFRLCGGDHQDGLASHLKRKTHPGRVASPNRTETLPSSIRQFAPRQEYARARATSLCQCERMPRQRRKNRCRTTWFRPHRAHKIVPQFRFHSVPLPIQRSCHT